MTAAIRVALLLALAWAAAAPALAQGNAADDEYTRYELLEPGSAKFRILYQVTAVSPGARYYFNPIRKGSEASDESVVDPATGARLKFRVVSGIEARADGFAGADSTTDYIRVELPRPVPPNGEVRILIDKTYRDARSYRHEGDEIVFDRSLGIRRNAIVLPAGYELTGCNVPAQVLSTDDGRIMVSFINPGPAAAPLVVRARRLAP